MKRKAFTLIEMLIVIALIAILMTMLISSFSQARYLAKRTKADAQLRQLISAWHEYFILYGEWPPFTGGDTDGVPMTYANLKYLIDPDENIRKLVLLNVTLKSENNNEPYCDPWATGNASDRMKSVYKLKFGTTDDTVTDETAQRLSVHFPNRKRQMMY